jgi:hypothetical protein
LLTRTLHPKTLSSLLRFEGNALLNVERSGAAVRIT